MWPLASRFSRRSNIPMYDSAGVERRLFSKYQVEVCVLVTQRFNKGNVSYRAFRRATVVTMDS
jgi:hypothetical protein